MSAQIIPMPGASLPGDAIRDRAGLLAQVVPFPKPHRGKLIADLEALLRVYHAARKVRETDNLIRR